jgi:hypothetical protein
VNERRRTRRTPFPVGLWASLLAALVCLAQPEPAHRVERWLCALASLPLRVLASVQAAPANAASAGAADAAAARVEALARRRDAVMARGVAAMPVDLAPVGARVVARLEPGAAGAPSVLELDLTQDEVAGCATFATLGDALVGFLAPRPSSAGPTDRARVHLLHHRPRHGLPRRVRAQILAGETAERRCLVEPAAAIDEWPLRCALPDDPYLAAGLDRPDLEVRTAPFPGDPLGAVPPGLRLGMLRVFGYADEGGTFLPIGLFVEPAVPANALNHVVLWRAGVAADASVRRPFDGGELVPVRLARLAAAGPGREQWFATSVAAGAWLPEGAALVAGLRLCGELDSAGYGYGVVIPFGQAGRDLPLVLLPQDPRLAPIDCRAWTLGRDGAEFRLAITTGGSGVPAGELFSGTEGPDWPAGLWIGTARPEPGAPGRMLVRCPETTDREALAVFRQRREVAR